MSDHDYRICKNDECNQCQELIDNGLIIACDECDLIGSSESDFLILKDDGRTLCEKCNLKIIMNKERRMN